MDFSKLIPRTTSLVGVVMVILKRRARSKLTLLPLRTCVWGVQNAQDHDLGLHWTGEPARDSREISCILRHESNAHIRRPRSMQRPKRTVCWLLHTIVRISTRTHQIRPKSWAGSTGLTNASIGRAHNIRHGDRAFQAHVPATAARTTARPSPNPVESAHRDIEEHGPLQLQVILERG